MRRVHPVVFGGFWWICLNILLFRMYFSHVQYYHCCEALMFRVWCYMAIASNICVPLGAGGLVPFGCCKAQIHNGELIYSIRRIIGKDSATLFPFFATLVAPMKPHVRKIKYWATKKNLLTFHYTGWFLGILIIFIMVYYNPYITGE